MAQSFHTTKKSFAAYKGHFNRAVKQYDSLLKVKPYPIWESLERSYNRVQKQLDVLITSADNMITLLESVEQSETSDFDAAKELNDITIFYDQLLTQQVQIETSFAEQKAAYTPTSTSTSTSNDPTISTPQTSGSSTPKIRVTALDPPLWNGVKAELGFT